MTALGDFVGDIVGDVDAILAFSPSSATLDRLEALDIDVVVVGRENEGDVETFVELPLDFVDLSERVQFGIQGALSDGYLEEGDSVAYAASLFGDDMDVVGRVRADASVRSGIYDLFVESRADPGVVRDVFDVVIELGRKGQKGDPVGALFVVGDAGKVMNKSRPLSYNPFEKSHVHVGDPIVNVMLKEFSRLDGAFVISDEGKIVSAYRYLEPSAEGVDIPKGLGTRHLAAGAITRDTNAVAIVLSESDGLVRAFKGGELILELDPEAY